jgi:hypothetical protein
LTELNPSPALAPVTTTVFPTWSGTEEGVIPHVSRGVTNGMTPLICGEFGLRWRKLAPNTKRRMGVAMQHSVVLKRQCIEAMQHVKLPEQRAGGRSGS